MSRGRQPGRSMRFSNKLRAVSTSALGSRQFAVNERLHALLSIGGASLLSLLLRWPALRLPLERDEGAYGYLGWLWLQGGVPYRDAFDHKPPLIHFLYSLLLLVGEPSALAIRLGATFWFLLGVAFVYGIARRLWNRDAALLATLLYAVVGSSFTLQGLVFNTEQALVVPALAALWLLLLYIDGRQWQAAALYGLAVAGVALIKPTPAPLLLLLLLLGLRRPWRLSFQGMLTMLLGLAAGVLPWLAYFAWQGAWDELWWSLVTYNRRYFVESQARFEVGAMVDILAPFAAWVLTALGGIALIHSKENSATAHTSSRQRWALVGWTGAFAVAGFASLRPYVHYYYPLLPGLALLVAPVLIWLMRQPHAPGSAQRLAHVVAIVGLVLILLAPTLRGNLLLLQLDPQEQSERLYGEDGVLFAEAQDVAAFVAAHTTPGTPIWVWGAEPEIYLLAQRPAATRYSYDYPLTLFPRAASEVALQLQRTPPAVVVVYAGARPDGFGEVVTRRGLVLLRQIGRFEIYGTP